MVDSVVPVPDSEVPYGRELGRHARINAIQHVIGPNAFGRSAPPDTISAKMEISAE